MKIFILLISLLVCGCQNKTVENYTFNYNDDIYLYDIIDTKNIITNNFKLDTRTLGTKELTIKYSNRKIQVNITIEDKEAPLLLCSSSYTITKGNDFNLQDKLFYGDNYDKSVKYEMIGNYNTNVIGNYEIKVVLTDSSNNQTSKNIMINVIEQTNNNPSKETYTDIKTIIEKHKNKDTKIGIDVSVWQGNIDFNKVKDAGVEFVIIRMGYGKYDNGTIKLDNRFIENYEKARQAGLKIGLYFYSYAQNILDITKEAYFILDNLKDKNIDLPIALDFENWSQFKNYNLSFTDLNDMADTFFNILNNKGYETMLYSSLNYLEYVWNTQNKTIWLAHYTNKTPYKGHYIWQLTNDGIVDGINGYVDLDILYEKS